MSTVGWLGSFCLAVCAVPQAYRCYKTKSADGIDKMFLLLWGLGEILSAIFVLVEASGHVSAPLALNYLTNLVAIGIISYYAIIRSRHRDSM